MKISKIIENLRLIFKHPLYMMVKISPSHLRSKIRRIISQESGIWAEKRDGEKEEPTEKLVVLDLPNKGQDIERYDTIELPLYNYPVVSIIIPVFNQFEYTYNCIKSVANNTKEIEYEVILADDNSSDCTIDIQKIIHNIILSRRKKNGGFIKNCNQAATLAKGKYICFLNNDTQVQCDWMKHLLDMIDTYDDIGIVGSKLLYPNGKLQEAGGIIWKDGSASNFGNGDIEGRSIYNQAREVDYISGAAIMIRKSLWVEIGGFDSRYEPAYYEDTDLAMKVRSRGYKVVYQPLSRVVHFEGVSCGYNLLSGVKENQIVNYGRFRAKWDEELRHKHYVYDSKVKRK